MAKQISIIKLAGTLDNITFYELDGKEYARKKSSLSAEQVLTSPSFARTRENATEFQKATIASKMIRRSLLPILIPKNYYNARLNKVGVEAIRQDVINPRGQRTVVDGNVNEYFGVEGIINELGIDYFDGTVNVIYNVANNLNIEIEPFVPFTDLTRPGGATHCRFDFAFALVDLENQTYVSTSQIGNYVDVNQNVLTSSVTYTLNLVKNDENYATACMTLKFYQFLNGVYYELYENQASVLILSASIS